MLNAFRRDLLIGILTLSTIFLSLLIVQQGRTIDSQRTLIRALFQDSLELNAIKVHEIQERLKK